MASAVVQPDRFLFRAGGHLLFGRDGNPSDIGPTRRVDHKAMVDRWFVHKDPDDNPIYVERAHPTIRKHTTPVCSTYTPNRNRFLRASQCSEPSGMEPFVLAHADFDIQNFIVSKESELRGIIDWDGVAAMPRTLGNERYPGWLTRDWDPAMYEYKELMEHGRNQNVCGKIRPNISPTTVTSMMA
ncbi:hypothetical protein BDV59DRAFT_186201 [Aspergillus ambiguus]|uniref:uncharacterized protein n=1 Tax=Aspergillus ambiguus TaxID=176160 RepID=UPI003CCE12A3